MKRSLLLCAIVLLICSKLPAQNDQAIEFYYYNSDLVRLNEQTLQYQMTPYEGYLFSISGSNSIESRYSFSRESRKSRFDLTLAKDQWFFTHLIQSGIISLYDDSSFDDGAGTYTNKIGFGAYGLTFHPLDSLNIYAKSYLYSKNEKARYDSLDGIQSRGYSYLYGASYSLPMTSFSLNLGIDHETKDLDRDRYWQNALLMNLLSYGSLGSMQVNLGYRRRKDDLFRINFVSAGSGFYERYDRMSNEQINAHIDLFLNPRDNLQISISDYFNQQKNRRDIDVINDNADFSNRASITTNADVVKSVHYENQIKYDYTIKDYSYTQNSSYNHNYSLGNRIIWQYAQSDSIMLGYYIEMKRSMYPDETIRRDKDNRKEIGRIGWTKYYHQRIKLSTWLLHSIENEISINSANSSNNKEIRVYSLTPDMSIVLGDKLLFRQSYSIRADYTGYMYALEQYRDNLYRQVSFRYSILYDDYPLIARSNDPLWLNLPYRNPTGRALSTELAFSQELNQFGYKVGDYYEVGITNRKNSLSWNLKYDIDDVYIFIQPRYSWGTWTEYSGIIGISGELNSGSVFEITLNPIGDQLKQLDWRFSFNLNLVF